MKKSNKNSTKRRVKDIRKISKHNKMSLQKHRTFDKRNLKFIKQDRDRQQIAKVFIDFSRAVNDFCGLFSTSYN